MVKNILFLSKRRPQSRDLYTSPYGRFYFLPLELSKLSHRVTICLFDYNGRECESKFADNIDWHTIGTRGNPLAAYRTTRHLISELKPDWIIGCSDTYFGILAVHFARLFKSQSIVDAYDNYASYIPFAMPLHQLWYWAARNANAVTVAGPSLAQLFDVHGVTRQSTIVPMAPDPDGFHLRDKFKSRYLLKLPYDKKLIGYCGAISSTRDIETLFRAISIMKIRDPSVQLVLSGRLDKNISIPNDALNLGFIPKEHIPILLNCFDAFAITNKDSQFGHYSYPIKLYEAMSSGVPVVASRTKSTAWILTEHPQNTVPAGNPRELADKLLSSIEGGRPEYSNLPTWEQSASLLNDIIQS